MQDRTVRDDNPSERIYSRIPSRPSDKVGLMSVVKCDIIGTSAPMMTARQYGEGTWTTGTL